MPKKTFIKNTRLLATGWILWRNAAKKRGTDIHFKSTIRHQKTTPEFNQRLYYTTNTPHD